MSGGPASAPAPALRAVVALVPGLPVGVAANVSACIAAGLAAACGGWAGRPLADAEGWRSSSSSHLPIAVLTAEEAALAALLERSHPAPDEGALVLFPRYAQRMHTAEDYWREHATRSHRTEPLLGLGLVGPGRWIRSLTGALPLLR